MMDLSRMSTSYKDVIAKGVSKKYLLSVNGRDYIFKANYGEYMQNVNEVFVSFLFKKLGVKNFVEYDFAKYKSDFGCISKSFKSENTKHEIALLDMMMNNYYFKKTGKLADIDKYYDNDFFDEFYESIENYEDCQYDFTVEQICDIVEVFCRNNKMNFDRNALKDRLNEIVVIDYFLSNADRHWSNVVFLINQSNEGKLNVELAPIFDNGECFSFNSSFNREDNKWENVYLTIGMSDIGIRNSFKDNNYFKNGNLTVIDIFELSKIDKSISDLAEKFLSLDIEGAISEFEEINKIKLPKEITNQIMNVYNLRTSQYEKAVNKLNKRLERTM